MFQKGFYILCFVVVGLNFQSCYRDSEIFIPDVVQIDEYIDALRRPSQTFTINTTVPGTFTTAGRAIFRFPTEGYYFEADGGTVSGDIVVYVKEIYRKGDMIRENAVTVTTDNRLLGSGGMFQLEMQQNGQQVLLRDDQKIEIDIPSQNTGYQEPLDGMKVFEGFVSPLVDNTTPGLLSWQQNNTGDTVVQNAWYDSVNQLETAGYSLNTGAYEWINCDYFDPSTNLVSCSFNLPTNANFQNTRIYIMYDDANAIQSAVYQWNTAKFLSTVAADRAITIVVLHVDNDQQLWYNFQQTTITGATAIEVPLEATTVAQLKDFLDSL